MGWTDNVLSGVSIMIVKKSSDFDEYPAPLVSSDCDCTTLDGFFLNVERLMSSELVALATGEELAAALLLWCRAWKQIPAASLPDDDRVLAAFAKTTDRRWQNIKSMALHGFVKCSDGRLYHRVLAVEAQRSYDRKNAHTAKRQADSERLRKWRGNSDETPMKRVSQPRQKRDSSVSQRVSSAVSLSLSNTPYPQGGKSGGEDLNPPPPTPTDTARPFHTVRKYLADPDPEYHHVIGCRDYPPGPRQPPTDIDPILIHPRIQWFWDSSWPRITPQVNGEFVDRCWERAAKAAGIKPWEWPGDITPLLDWLDADIPPDSIVAAFAEVAKSPNYSPPRSLMYFDRAVRRRGIRRVA